MEPPVPALGSVVLFCDDNMGLDRIRTAIVHAVNPETPWVIGLSFFTGYAENPVRVRDDIPLDAGHGDARRAHEPGTWRWPVRS